MKLLNESGNYWNNTGELQAEYDLIYDKFVPSQGTAKHKSAEKLRCISSLYHDYYNNGWGVNDKEYEIGQMKMVELNANISSAERRAFNTLSKLYNKVWDLSHTEYEEDDYYEDEDNDYGYDTYTELYEPSASEEREIEAALETAATVCVRLCIEDGLLEQGGLKTEGRGINSDLNKALKDGELYGVNMSAAKKYLLPQQIKILRDELQLNNKLVIYKTDENYVYVANSSIRGKFMKGIAIPLRYASEILIEA